MVAPSFTALVDHDADSFYEVELKVTDSDGLTDSRIIELRPETVAFTLASVPEGAPLSYSGIEGVGPMFRTAAIGYRTTISAAESFLSDGREWVFDHWSDGEARAHDVTVPASATNLTAFYRDTAVGGAAPNTATPQSPPTPPSAGPKPDATRPIVRITAPRRRATVAGRVRLRAIASDNVGIQTVQFKLDGRRLGRADSRAPFWLRWNTRTVKNGTHRLTAVARDAAGNTTISRVVRIKVKNERRGGRRGS